MNARLNDQLTFDIGSNNSETVLDSFDSDEVLELNKLLTNKRLAELVEEQCGLSLECLINKITH